MQHANGKYYQVTRIDMLKDGSIHYACGTPHLWEYNNKFSPVILTHEILEKNFVYDELEDTFNLSDDYFDIVIRERNEYTWELSYHNTEVHFLDTVINGIGFVHELQNILRFLCIDKEITL